MPLQSGARLGPYEVLSALGAGGMGEVWRARDTRLDRDVALKVLPEAFVADPDRLARFEREAKVLASLNHPHIGGIHGLEEANGVKALVLELVEGPTLADRIARGPLPIDEALPIARQIAEALDAAHELGIIHRDLKPANVKVKRDGTVKVLDFGLAKGLEPQLASGQADFSHSPTRTPGVAATQMGVIMGTAPYMAPEQARGRPVDKRADIWAFGCVLYEMLTGRQLFTGDSVTDTLAAVLNQEPQWERVPAKARKLLKSCLEKDPKLRLRDIADAFRLLDEAPARPVTMSRIWPAVAAVLALASAVAVLAPRRSEAPPAQPPVALDLDLGPEVSLRTGIGPAAVLSPDGTRLAFVSHEPDGSRRLFTRRLDEQKGLPLSNTQGAYAPFFSPDGQWVGFFAEGKLKKTRIDGGAPVVLCDAPAGRGASWGEDGQIIAAVDSQAGLVRVPPEGGSPTPVTQLGIGPVSHRWPQVLPGGKAVLFSVGIEYGNYERAEIAVVSLEDHQTKIVHQGMYPRYLTSGHLAYVTKGMLFVVPLDLHRLEVRGTAVSLMEVSNNTNIGHAQIDFTPSGTIAYRSGRTEGRTTLQWVDGAGRTESLGSAPAGYLNPRLSPDGTRLALKVTEASSADIWMYDLQRGNKTRLTNGEALNSWPVWSADGNYVIFQSAEGMFWTRADGAGEPMPLIQSKNVQIPSSFTPDGTRLAFSELNAGGGGTIQTVRVENVSGELRAGKPELFLETSTPNTQATFSPDGRWMAYADVESGRYEVYVRAFPDNGSKVQISNAGGMLPLWSRKPGELFYRTDEQRIMVVSYTVMEEGFVAGKPRVWLEPQLSNSGLSRNLDLAPDGARFVVLMPEDSPEPRELQSHIKVVVNFFDEIRRRAPAK